MEKRRGCKNGLGIFKVDRIMLTKQFKYALLHAHKRETIEYGIPLINLPWAFKDSWIIRLPQKEKRLGYINPAIRQLR